MASLLHSHRRSRSASTTAKSVSNLLQRRDTYASYMYGSSLTFSGRMCVYPNLLFSPLPLSATPALTAFFFPGARSVIIGENDRRGMTDSSGDDANFGGNDPGLIAEHAIVGSQMILQTVFEGVRIIMAIPIPPFQRKTKAFNEVRLPLRSSKEFPSQRIENMNTLGSWHAT